MDKYDLGIIRSDLDAAFRELKGLEGHLGLIREHLVRAAREMDSLTEMDSLRVVSAAVRGADIIVTRISKAQTSEALAESRTHNLRRVLTHISDRLDSTENAEDAA